MVRPHIGRQDRLRDKLFITLSQMTTLRGGISINDSLHSSFGEDVSEPLHQWHDNVVFWRELHLGGAQFLPFRFTQRTPVPRPAINKGINVEPQTNPAMLLVKSWPFGDTVPQRRHRRLSDFDQNVALSIKTLSNLDTACIMQPLDLLKSEYTIMWSRMVHPRFWCTLRLILCYECVICGFISRTYAVCFQHRSRRIQCLGNQHLHPFSIAKSGENTWNILPNLSFVFYGTLSSSVKMFLSWTSWTETTEMEGKQVCFWH